MVGKVRFSQRSPDEAELEKRKPGSSPGIQIPAFGLRRDYRAPRVGTG